MFHTSVASMLASLFLGVDFDRMTGQQKWRSGNTQKFFWCSLSSLALSLWQSFHNQWVSSHHHCYPTPTSSSSSSTLFSVLITSNSPASQKLQSQIVSEIWWNAFLFLSGRASQPCLHWKGFFVCTRKVICCKNFTNSGAFSSLLQKLID